MSLVEDVSPLSVSSLPEERLARNLRPKSYAAAAAVVDSSNKDTDDVGELDGYEEDNGSWSPKPQLSNGKKKIKRSKKMLTKRDSIEKEPLVEERYSNGDGLTSLRKGPDYNDSLQLDNLERRPEMGKDRPGLTSGRMAGMGWGRSKSVIPLIRSVPYIN